MPIHSSRDINIPEDLATRFQEPMASVWSTRLLVDVRKRTSDFASDHTAMVEEVCDWAREKTKSNSQSDLIEQERKRIKRVAEQMKQVGKEAVGDLREVVKTNIAETIKKPIKKACDEFVESQTLGRSRLVASGRCRRRGARPGRHCA
jgi:hypothetical protein